MTPKSRLEDRFERALFAARWLMAPMYLGLVLGLAMLLVVFVRELGEYVLELGHMTSEDAVLAVLSLIDISLAGNLLLIVLYSGYETFVSRIESVEQGDRPVWMGTIDFAALKLKLIASIVAISGLHLLKWFIWIGNADSADEFQSKQVMWLVAIHLTFVTAGVLLALMDWLAARSRH